MDAASFNPADPVRITGIVHEDAIAAFDAGDLYRADYLAYMANFREMRAMSNSAANATSAMTWANRPRMTDQSWPVRGRGWPLEAQIALALLLPGVDVYVTMPYNADDDYYTQAATYLRDTVPPDRALKVEWSNEPWHTNFNVYKYKLEPEAIAKYGHFSHWPHVQAEHATKMAVIFRNVWAASANPKPTLVNVLGAQTFNPWNTGKLLAPTMWEAADPTGYTDPKTVFDAVSITTYFGTNTYPTKSLRDALKAQIVADPVAARAWMRDQLLTDGYPKGLYEVARAIRGHKAHTDPAGLDVTFYEGGQHIHHVYGFSQAEITEDDKAVVLPWLRDFCASAEMGQVYTVLYRLLVLEGVGPFMQFVETTTNTDIESWGLTPSVGATSARLQALLHEDAYTDPWW